jgi:membrane fusion protein (multidrug efflux system)
MKHLPIPAIILALTVLSLSGCTKTEGHIVAHGHGEEQRKIVLTSPVLKDVITTEQYVCQIHSRRHIEVCALEMGYLERIPVKEGQAVKQGDLMFKIVPTLYQAKLDSEVAEAQLAQIEFNNTKNLFEQHVVSDKEVALAQAKLAKAQALVKLAQSELNFTEVKAPFDGIIDRLHEQQGSLVEEGDMLTTLSDNRVMWVYFNVPEARYLEYETGSTQAQDDDDDADDDEDEDGADDADDDDDDADDVEDEEEVQLEDLQIELVLANGERFEQPGAISAIEGEFNNETGNIAFRADFPNPDGLLRHGQTGSVLIHRVLHGAIVIPQRATFEILAKRYVFKVGEDHVVHQHEIEVENELEDVYVIKQGVNAGDTIVLEGVRAVRDGDTVEPGDSEFRPPEEVLNNLKNAAE